MDIGRAFGAPFRDSKWIGKTALAVLFSIIPIVNLAVQGWGIAYVGTVARGDERLPEWSDFGRLWIKGLTFAFASLTYYLPAFIIVLAFGVPGAVSAAAQSDGLAGLSTMLGSVAMGLMVAALYVLAASFLVQGARCNFAVHSTFSSAFDLKAVVTRVGRNFGAYFTAWILGVLIVWGTYIVSYVVAFLVASIPCLGQIAALVLLPVFTGFGVIMGMCANSIWGRYATIAYGTDVSSAPGFRNTEAGHSGVPTIPPAPRAHDATPTSGLTGKAAVAAAVAAAARPAKPEVDAVDSPLTPEPSDVPPVIAELGVVPDSSGGKVADATEPLAEVPRAPDTTPEPDTPAEPVIEPKQADAPAAAQAAEPTPHAAPVQAPETIEPDPVPYPQTAATNTADHRSTVAPPTPQPPPTGAVSPARQRFELERTEGPGTIGERWGLPDQSVRVGRERDCFISLPDGKVSRVHASLTATDDGVSVTDHGSSNGTFVGGVRMGTDAAHATVGDEIRFGDTVLTVRAAR